MLMIIYNHTLRYLSPQVSVNFCPCSEMQPSRCTVYSVKLHRLPIQKIFCNVFSIDSIYFSKYFWHCIMETMYMSVGCVLTIFFKIQNTNVKHRLRIYSVYPSFVCLLSDPLFTFSVLCFVMQGLTFLLPLPVFSGFLICLANKRHWEKAGRPRFLSLPLAAETGAGAGAETVIFLSFFLPLHFCKSVASLPLQWFQ